MIFLWAQTSEVDETAAGELTLPPGKECPTSIIYNYPTHSERYQRDFDDADRFVLTTEEGLK